MRFLNFAKRLGAKSVLAKIVAMVSLATASMGAMAFPDEEEVYDLLSRQSGHEVQGLQRIQANKPWYGVRFSEYPETVFFTVRDGSFFTSVDKSGRVGYYTYDLRPVYPGHPNFSKLAKKALANVGNDAFIDVTFGQPLKTAYIITDPQCPYCIKLEKIIRSNFTPRDNVRFRFLFMPLESKPGSRDIATKIYCSPNRTQALLNWYATFKIDGPTPPVTCKARASESMLWSSFMGLSSVPTIFFQDGEMMTNGFNAQTIRAKLGL